MQNEAPNVRFRQADVIYVSVFEAQEAHLLSYYFCQCRRSRLNFSTVRRAQVNLFNGFAGSPFNVHRTARNNEDVRGEHKKRFMKFSCSVRRNHGKHQKNTTKFTNTTNTADTDDLRLEKRELPMRPRDAYRGRHERTIPENLCREIQNRNSQ